MGVLREKRPMIPGATSTIDRGMRRMIKAELLKCRVPDRTGPVWSDDGCRELFVLSFVDGGEDQVPRRKSVHVNPWSLRLRQRVGCYGKDIVLPAIL